MGHIELITDKLLFKAKKRELLRLGMTPLDYCQFLLENDS